MPDMWQHQIRAYLTDAGLDHLRADPDHPSVASILAALHPHDATLVSQLDAFEAFLADPAQADTPLGRWTAATLADPAKRAKHRAALAIRVRGAEVYDPTIADALMASLEPLIGHTALLRLSRHDTNPATNLPIPQAFG